MTARAPVRFDIPDGAPPRSCLSCGSRIFWIETKTGRRMPIDADGTSHFATCTASSKWRGSSRAEQTDLFAGGKK